MAGSFGTLLLFGHGVLVLPELVVGASYPFLTYWYFYLPDYVLAALMYTALGRVVLSLFVDPDSTNYIWRFFCRITDPFFAWIEPVTPKAAVPVVLWLFGFVWLFWLRFALRVLYTALRLIPPM